MITDSRVSISMFFLFFYFTGIASAQTGENNSISGHVPTNKNYDIKVVLDHIFISEKNDSLEVSEIVVFRNEGQEIEYSGDNHTFFAISTQPEVRNLKTQAMECCLVQEEGIVYMDPMQSIKPGENFEMKIFYTVDMQGLEYLFNKRTIYNTTSLSLFVDKKSGMRLEGIDGTLTLAGIEYNVVDFNDLRAGETVSIQIKIARTQDYLYEVIALISLFSIGLVYRFREKIFRKYKRELTLEELESEKKKIFKTIYGFERHAGPESSEELIKLMDEYRQKAIRIIIKIDKLKKRGDNNVKIKKT